MIAIQLSLRRYVLDVGYIGVAGKAIMGKATRKVEKHIAVKTVLMVSNVDVAYEVEVM
jgi:hypothetical protein